MKEIVLVLIGAACSALGGCAAIWYRAKKARQIKMEERAAEHQFEASKKALRLTRELRTLLVKREHENARQFHRDHSVWFSDSWMFLPDGFVEGWKVIALELGKLSRMDQSVTGTDDENKNTGRIETAVAIGAALPKLAVEAENASRKAMGLEEAE